MTTSRFTPAPPPITRLLADRVRVLAHESNDRAPGFLYAIALPNGVELHVDLGALPSLANVSPSGERE
jgi:hypothetical protein